MSQIETGEPFAFYYEQAKQHLSSADNLWLKAWRARALEDFQRLGFPTRHHEDWKYTKIDHLLAQRFTLAEQTHHNKPKTLPAEHLDGYHVYCINGQLESNVLLPGVSIQSFSEALRLNPDLLARYLGKADLVNNGFHALSDVLLQTGVVIHLAENTRLEQPIIIHFWQDNNQKAVHSRQILIAEANTRATLIESYAGEEGSSYLTNTLTEAFLASNAEITHYKIQIESKKAYHIGHLAVRQRSHSVFNSHSVQRGGCLVRSDSAFYLDEEYSRCLLNSIYIPGNEQHIDQHTTVYHRVPHCDSQQDYKGILTGRGRAVFNGKVVVERDAQQTNARQQNKNLMLSGQAEVDSKPQLEIYADDVSCSHGATVGQLDEEALFYLTSRGIEPDLARHYLIQAFAAENLSAMDNRQVVSWLQDLIRLG